jgi:hypothetical protein
MRTPTERFVDTLAEAFSAAGVHLSEQQRVRMEDAFYDAVNRIAEGTVQYATDPRYGE